MGVFDGLDDLGKVLGELVDGRGTPDPAAPGGGQPPSSGTVSRLGRVIKGAMGSEILDAGQLVIAGMRLTTGWGEPEQGQAFGQGSARFTSAGETVGSAYPGDDWQGGGADSYAAANRAQADRTASMAVLDHEVSAVIAGEAFQVSHHRDKLDEVSNYLGDLSYVTWSLALIPGVGRAMKAAAEVAAVQTALSLCSTELYFLSQETDENAAKLQKIASEYSALTRKAAPPVLGDPPPSVEPATSADLPDDRTVEAVPQPPAAGGGPPAPAPQAPTGPGPATPVPEPPVADRAALDSVSPEAQATESAAPAELMSGMVSAFGAVGGVIGSMVAPMAAVLTGAAGAAGQSLSALTTAQAEPAAEDTSRDGDAESDRAATDRDVADDGATAGDDVADPVPTDVVAESEAPPALTADKLEPDHPVAPPAATRPPQ